jgi:hypothetical protein
MSAVRWGSNIERGYSLPIPPVNRPEYLDFILAESGLTAVRFGGPDNLPLEPSMKWAAKFRRTPA